MNRRKAILAFSGIAASSALIAVPRRSVLAQATTETSTVPELTPLEYRARTLRVGSFSKDISQVALTRATHPKVRQFAQFEVNEQTAVAQVLTDVNNPPPKPLTAEQEALLNRLQSQSGKAFDATYVQQQVAGHQQLAAIQQGFLKATLVGNDDEHIAVLARVMIQMHLTMLEELQSEITA